MKARRSPFSYAFHAVTITAVLGSAAACLPGGLVIPGLDFDNVEMAAFQNCDDLEADLKQRALQKAQLQSAAALSGRTYSPQTSNVGKDSPQPFTTTNTQEDNVDEADIFKVDGTYAYALHRGELVIVEAVRGDSTSRTITEGKIVSRTDLGGPAFEMYITGDRAAVMFHTSQREVKEHFQADAPQRDVNDEVTKVALLDITDRHAPKVLRELLVEGEYISSRRVDDRVYIVAKALLDGPVTDGAPTSDRWLTDRRSAIESASLDAWIPYYYTLDYDSTGRVSREAKRCSCKDTYRSPAAEGDDAVAVYSFGLEAGETQVETATIIGDGALVYGSTRGIVVALNNYAAAEFEDDDFWGEDDSDSFQSEKEKQVTYLHRFALSGGGKVEYQAAGQVDGWALNQFSFSEHRGYLRVATQIDDESRGTRETGVFVLKVEDKNKARYRTKGHQAEYLSVIGEVRGIGLDEELYAVRFVGDVGYVVTFRVTDPLYTIDLSTPNAPSVRGELMIPGYSTYLHPLEDGYLIGLGKIDDGFDEGLKLSVFDVRNLDSPKVVEERVIGTVSAESEAIDDHRAFRYLPSHGKMILPVDMGAHGDGLYVYDVSTRSGFEYLDRIEHGSGHALRAYAVGDYLYGYSTAGITITDLESMRTVVTLDL